MRLSMLLFIAYALTGCGKSVKTQVTHCGQTISILSDNSIDPSSLQPFERACVKDLRTNAVSDWNGIYRQVSSTCGFWSTLSPTPYTDNYVVSVANDLTLVDSDPDPADVTFEYVMCP